MAKFLNTLFILFVSSVIIFASSNEGEYNVYFRLGESSISTARYANIDNAVFEIFRTNLLKFPAFKNIMDEEFDINITITIKEENGIFDTTIEIIRDNLRSTANLTKKSREFFQVQRDLLEIVIEVMNISLTREQYINLVNVSTRSLTALIHYGNALELRKKGEDLELFRLLSEAVRSDGSFSQALSLYNNVFRNLERYYSDSIRFARHNINNYLNLVDLYIINSDFLKAMEIIQKAKEVFGENRELLIKEGEVFYEAGSYSRAITVYEDIFKRDDRDLDMMYRLGRSYEKNQNYDEAIEFFQQIIRFEPNNINAILRLSEIYEEKGDYENALGMLRDLLRTSFDMGEVQLRIARIYYLNEEYNRAIDILKSILSRDRDNISSLELLADIYSHVNNHDSAIDYYNRVLKIDPENLPVYDKLAIVYERTNDRRLNEVFLTLGNLYKSRNEFEEAKEYFTRAYEIDRNDPNYYLEMGNLHFALTEYEEAIGFYQRADSLGLKDSAMFNNMANIYIMQNRMRRAMDITLKNLDLDPDNIEIQFTLGKIYYYQNDFDSAFKIFEDIKEFMSDNHEYFYLLGIIFIEKGNYKTGIECFRQAFILKTDLNPEHPYPRTYNNLMGIIDNIDYARGDEFILIIPGSSGFISSAFLDIRNMNYDRDLIYKFIIEILSSKIRIRSMDDTIEYIGDRGIDIYADDFLSAGYLKDIMTSLRSDGIIYINLDKQPQTLTAIRGQGVISSDFVFFRRGMDVPKRDTIMIYVKFEKSIILFYSMIIFFSLIALIGFGYGFVKYKAIKKGYGALRIKIIYPANRRIPMNVMLNPTKRTATLEMGEALFTRLVVGHYTALFRGVLTRYDEIMDEMRTIGDFRMKEKIRINKNEISEITLDFSKELYIEVYITRKNQYVEGAEVFIRELNITKFTNENGYVSFIVPKMTFTFIVNYKDLSAEKRVEIDDESTAIFIEIDPLLRASSQKKSISKIDFEYLE